MKYTILLFLLLCFLSACNEAAEKDYCLISGSYVGVEKEAKEMELCKVENGTLERVANSVIAEDGSFAFMYIVKNPGLYVLNVINKKYKNVVPKDHNLKRFYLEAGVEVVLEVDEGNYTLTKTNSKENELLSEWNCWVDSVYAYSHGYSYQANRQYTDFFPLIPRFVKTAEDFKHKIQDIDITCKELLTFLVDADMYYTCADYRRSPLYKHPTKEEVPSFYQDIINLGKPKSDLWAQMPFGIDYLYAYGYVCYKEDPIGYSRNTWSRVMLNFIPDVLSIKQYYAVHMMHKYQMKGAQLEEYKKDIQAIVKDSALLVNIKNYELSIREDMKPGDVGYDFEGEDVDKKKHKFSDYRGKIVLLDVWATWCGPCVKEIPHLENLERELHGEDIVFISISIDKVINRDRWSNYVKDNNLGGVQLITAGDFDSDVCKVYKISSIPRFMIFDREGRVVSLHADRPSNPKLLAKLRELLKKK